jgi:hypothetical protein
MKFPLIACCLLLLATPGPAQPPPAPPRPSMTIIKRTNVFPIRARRTKEQKRRLHPDAGDLRAYEAFLSGPRTGIFRLLPDLGCYENMNVVKADEQCLQAIPESSSYSFREKEHTIESLADIRLKNGYLISDGILAQAIMVKLGGVPLEKVTPESEGLGFLQNYEPPSSGPEAQKQYVQVASGIRDGRHEYRKALRAEEDTTYALRVVAYRGSLYRSFRGYRFDLLEGDKRIDLTLAFRIIRKDADGALTLVWKELEKRDAPRLRFPKRGERPLR